MNSVFRLEAKLFANQMLSSQGGTRNAPVNSICNRYKQVFDVCFSI